MITRLVLTSSYILFGIVAPCVLYNYRFHLLYSDEMKPKVDIRCLMVKPGRWCRGVLRIGLAANFSRPQRVEVNSDSCQKPDATASQTRPYSLVAASDKRRGTTGIRADQPYSAEYLDRTCSNFWTPAGDLTLPARMSLAATGLP